jgi:hypothetical protein
MGSSDCILHDFKVRIHSLWDYGLKFIWFKVSNNDYQILSSCLGYSHDSISDIIKYTELSHQPGRVGPGKWGNLLDLYIERNKFYNRNNNEEESWIRFMGNSKQENTSKIISI